MNPILQAMASHRSVRQYAQQPLDETCVRQAVEAAQRAASSSNVQAYSVLQVTDPERRQRLAELAGQQQQVRSAGGFFVICADQRRNVLLGERLKRPHQANLETFLLAVIDASLFAQNLALAFESQGLGTCFIGGLRNELTRVDELLALPEHVMALYGLCAGLPALDPSGSTLRPRLPVEAVLLHERYPSDEDLMAHIASYDAQIGEWYAQHGRPGYDWSGGVSRNFQEAKREGLLDYYTSKGARFR